MDFCYGYPFFCHRGGDLFLTLRGGASPPFPPPPCPCVMKDLSKITFSIFSRYDFKSKTREKVYAPGILKDAPYKIDAPAALQIPLYKRIPWSGPRPRKVAVIEQKKPRSGLQFYSRENKRPRAHFVRLCDQRPNVRVHSDNDIDTALKDAAFVSGVKRESGFLRKTIVKRRRPFLEPDSLD